MRHLLSFILVFCLCAPGKSEAPFRYHLVPGDIFQLDITILQESHSKSPLADRNVSLDVSTGIRFRVQDIDSSGNYLMECHYCNPSLSLFSTSLDLSLDSETGKQTVLSRFTDTLETFTFNLLMDPYGKPLKLDTLDGAIASLAQSGGNGTQEQEIVVSTLKDAFGYAAFLNLCHTTLNLYPQDSGPSARKEVIRHLNETSMSQLNQFYCSVTPDGNWRVQGVGVIDTQDPDQEDEKGRVLTQIRGNQTYDYLCDPASGIILEGISRQKIFVKSMYRDSNHFPEGLEIPSETVTEYEIRGTFQKDGVNE